MKPIWTDGDLAERLVAHRGEMAHYPENSLRSVQAALEGGARWIEVDVQFSQDSIPYLLHDAELDRTSETAGSVFHFSSEALASVSVHEPKRFGKVHYPEPIAPLADLMALVAQYKEAKVLVEIKHHTVQYFSKAQVEQALDEVLAEHKARCYVISYHAAILKRVQERGYAIGWVLARHDEASQALAKRLKPELMICNHTKIQNLSTDLWQGKSIDGEPWRWMLYEVNELTRILSLDHLGVDLIETASPSSLIEQLGGK